MSGGKVSATKIYIDSKHNIFLHFLRPRPPPVALNYLHTILSDADMNNNDTVRCPKPQPEDECQER